MGAAITFGISLSVLGAFLFLKQWELRAGRMFFPGLRAKADALVLSYTTGLHSLTPRPRKDLAKHMLREGAHSGTVLLLHGVHFLERKLLRLINMIKGRGASTHPTTASEFLKSVAESKQNGRGEIL